MAGASAVGTKEFFETAKYAIAAAAVVIAKTKMIFFEFVKFITYDKKFIFAMRPILQNNPLMRKGQTAVLTAVSTAK